MKKQQFPFVLVRAKLLRAFQIKMSIAKKKIATSNKFCLIEYVLVLSDIMYIYSK